MADPLSTNPGASPFSPETTQGIGSALQVIGSLKQGLDESKAHKALADQYIQKGLQDARDFNRQQSAALSSARAARAASGVILSTGSSLLVDEASVFEIAQGVARIEADAAAKAHAQRKAAKKKKRGTLLGTVGAVAGAVVGGPQGAVIGSQIGQSLA